MINSGKVLINTRNLGPIHDILHGQNPPQGAALNQLLSFLSMYCLADGLLYDDSVPKKYLTNFQNQVHDLGIEKKVKAVNMANGSALESLTAQSLGVCHTEINKVIDQAGFGYKAIDETSAIGFFEQVKHMRNTHSKLTVAQEALDNDLHGAKLLMALAGEQNSSLLGRLNPDHWNLGQKQTLLSGMMGTFRTFLLTGMAGEKGAQYATNPEFVKLLEDKGKVTWGSLLKEFHEPGIADVPDKPTDWIWKFPLIGSALIIDARKAKIPPNQLLSFADRFKKSRKLKSLVKDLRDRYEHSGDDLFELSYQMNNLWSDVLTTATNREDCLEILKTGLSYAVIPAVVAGATQALVSPDNFVVTGLSTALAGAAVAFVVYNKQRKQKHLSAISNLSSYSTNVEGIFHNSVEALWRNR